MAHPKKNLSVTEAQRLLLSLEDDSLDEDPSSSDDECLEDPGETILKLCTPPQLCEEQTDANSRASNSVSLESSNFGCELQALSTDNSDIENLSDSDDSESSESDSSFDEIDDVPLIRVGPKYNDGWGMTEIPDAIAIPNTQPNILANISPTCTAIETFLLFFNHDIMHLTVEQTNLYARQKKKLNWQDVTLTDIEVFIGILITMGLHRLPQVEDYWSSDPILNVRAISQVMTRERFQQILGCLHFSNNNNAPKTDDLHNDKLFKIQKLFELMNEACRNCYGCSSKQSIDESMVKFKGRSSLKQYMPLKPIKRGYKIWVRADVDTGYAYQFEIYRGKEANAPDSLGMRVVTKLAEAVANTDTLLGFDNFFSSYDLMLVLHRDGIGAVATLRTNRKQLPPFLQKKEKLKRGQYMWQAKGPLSVYKWQDTKEVHIISNMHNPTDKSIVIRTTKTGVKVAVPCPKAISDYQKLMGGVDLFDHKRQCHSVSRRSKKSWPRLFYFVLDLAIVNASIIYWKKIGKYVTQKDFRLQLARALLMKSKKVSRRTSEKYRRCRKRHEEKRSTGVPNELRVACVGKHMP